MQHALWQNPSLYSVSTLEMKHSHLAGLVAFKWTLCRRSQSASKQTLILFDMNATWTKNIYTNQKQDVLS